MNGGSCLTPKNWEGLHIVVHIRSSISFRSSNTEAQLQDQAMQVRVGTGTSTYPMLLINAILTYLTRPVQSSSFACGPSLLVNCSLRLLSNRSYLRRSSVWSGESR